MTTGYKKNKPGYFYVYYYDVLNSTPIFKFGVSNRHPSNREREQLAGQIVNKSELLFSEYFSDGSIPLQIENNIKLNYETKRTNWLTSGKTETVKGDDRNFIRFVELLIANIESGI